MNQSSKLITAILFLVTLVISFVSANKYPASIAVQDRLVYRTYSVILDGKRQTASSIDLNLSFVPNESDFSYGNIFQTTSKSNGLRVELQPSGNLYLISNESNVELICSSIIARDEYNLVLQYYQNKEITVFLSNKKGRICKLNTALMNVSIDDFVFGSGFEKKRTFSGKIFINSLTANYLYISKIVNYLIMLNGFLLAFVAFLLFESSGPKSDLTSSTYITIIIALACFTIVGVTFKKLPSDFTAKYKWAGYFAFVPIFLITISNYKPTIKLKNLKLTALSLAIALMCYMISVAFRAKYDSTLSFLLVPTFAILIYLRLGLLQAVTGVSLVLSLFQLTNITHLIAIQNFSVYYSQFILILILIIFYTIEKIEYQKNCST